MASDVCWDPLELLRLPAERLSYSVHSASGFHASFVPSHIIADKPNDDNSRWTAPSPEDRRMQARKAALVGNADAKVAGKDRRRAPEWITVELDDIALVRTVGFGKTTKAHPCNLAEFTLWGGLSSDPLSMEPLLEGSLKNDANTETFELPIQIGELESNATTPLPVKFLRIDCHVAANANYSISIWHLFLEGYSPTRLAAGCLPSASDLVSLYESHRHLHTTRLILAHLRRSGPMYLPAFRTLLGTLATARVGTPAETRLEHPLLAALHEAFVLRGDWDRSESILDEILAAGLLDEWDGTAGGTKGRTTAKWTRIGPSEEEEEMLPAGTWPRGRGGHAMVRVGRKILLYGGWDGERELGDVWEFDLPLNANDVGPGSGAGKWRCLDDGTTSGKGAPAAAPKPGPRSCHQMVVDERDGWVYVLGARRDELDNAGNADDNDDANEDHNNGGDGSVQGPSGMDLDENPDAAARRGRGSATRTARPSSEERWKSDFWRYKAAGPDRGTWELLSEDTRRDGGPALLFDHQMVIHSATSRLFVFGGKNQPFVPGAAAAAAALAFSDRIAESSAGLFSETARSRYSGMWCYHLDTRTWTHLFGDPLSPSNTPPGPSANGGSSDRLLSRAGHALVLDPDPLHPTLYVYSGQRNEQYLQDLWAIRLASAVVHTEDEDERGRGPERKVDSASERQDRALQDESALWRQGTVLDFPFGASGSASAAINRSLVDLSALPTSPEASPSRQGGRGNSSVPTILQIRRLWPPTSAPPATAPVAIPPASFTPRITLDPTTRNWTLLTGLIRSVPAMGTSSDMAEGCLRGVWRRRTPRKVRTADLGWEKIEEEWGSVPGATEDGARGGAGDAARQALPPPRFATQVVYDPLLQDHYLFGGHPEVQPGESVDWRQSDMWRLRIIDPTPQEAHRKAKFLLRKQRFIELCRTAPTLLALQYLQNDLASVVDHSSPAESSAFRSCMTALMSAPARMNIDIPLDGSQELPSPGGSDVGSDRLESGLYRERHGLFEEISRLVPQSERQPDENLEDTSRLLRVWQMTGTRA
ncbi:hypothetical protein JCM3774_003636 [Rhodotorula dairenensis]